VDNPPTDQQTICALLDVIAGGVTFMQRRKIARALKRRAQAHAPFNEPVNEAARIAFVRRKVASALAGGAGERMLYSSHESECSKRDEERALFLVRSICCADDVQAAALLEETRAATEALCLACRAIIDALAAELHTRRFLSREEIRVLLFDCGLRDEALRLKCREIAPFLP
jgi:hypothetical protein